VEGQLESLRRQVRARENDLRDLREWYTRVQEEVRFQGIYERCDTTFERPFLHLDGLKVSASGSLNPLSDVPARFWLMCRSTIPASGALLRSSRQNARRPSGYERFVHVTAILCDYGKLHCPRCHFALGRALPVVKQPLVPSSLLPLSDIGQKHVPSIWNAGAGRGPCALHVGDPGGAGPPERLPA
jgi:hypothetical protein